MTPTLTIALLGAIESLLCARVADQISGLPRHDPNQELMAQGVANLVVPFFGGMPATGTIARTVTNMRAGRQLAGRLAWCMRRRCWRWCWWPRRWRGTCRCAVLAGILLFVGWNMGEWREFSPYRLRHFSQHYRVLMLGTFFLTVVFDLTVAVQAGIVLACVFFIRRMSALFRVELVSLQPPVLTYRLYGALFFGAAARLDEAVNAVERAPRGMTVVLDAMHLISIDATGLDALRQLHKAVQDARRRAAHRAAAGAATRGVRALRFRRRAGGRPGRQRARGLRRPAARRAENRPPGMRPVLQPTRPPRIALQRQDSAVQPCHPRPGTRRAAGSTSPIRSWARARSTWSWSRAGYRMSRRRGRTPITRASTGASPASPA